MNAQDIPSPAVAALRRFWAAEEHYIASVSSNRASARRPMKACSERRNALRAAEGSFHAPIPLLLPPLASKMSPKIRTKLPYHAPVSARRFAAPSQLRRIIALPGRITRQ